MIRIRITGRMLSSAKTIAESMGKLPGSRMRGTRNVSSALAELSMLSICPYAFLVHGDYDYDIYNRGVKLEVKSKQVNYKPKEYYDVTTFAKDRVQSADFYIFSHVMGDHTACYLLGYYPVNEFYKDSHLVRAGTQVNGGLVYKEDNYVMKVSDLKRIESQAIIIKKERNYD